ncbi:hypothetical protein Tco_0325630, partial [Tanacetum coccineum]
MASQREFILGHGLEEDSDDEVEGTNVERAKSDEEATYTEDQGNEAVKDTNTDL